MAFSNGFKLLGTMPQPYHQDRAPGQLTNA
jgi:hypothetical protein